MKDRPRFRRMIFIAACLAVFVGVATYQLTQVSWPSVDQKGEAIAALEQLTVSQRIFTGAYDRAQFGDGWQSVNGCDTRNSVLYRDMTQTAVSGGCVVLSGTLFDPYTGVTLQFTRGASTSGSVQIDHVVALKDAWQKGAYAFDQQQRLTLANDPLELIAVGGKANQQKSDGDAADWLPAYAPFQCQYIARQIAVKQKYKLTVTRSEKQAMRTVLNQCPAQSLPKK